MVLLWQRFANYFIVMKNAFKKNTSIFKSVKSFILNFYAFFFLESSEHEDKSTDASGEMPTTCPSDTPTDAPKEENEAPKSPPKPDENDELGPLPDNWEMAYTEKGEVYFIE